MEIMAGCSTNQLPMQSRQQPGNLMPILQRMFDQIGRCAALSILFCAAVPAQAADSYTIPHGGTVVVDEHAECRLITNNHASGQSIWVPTKTAQEWTSFRDHAAAGTTVVVCDKTPNAFSFNDVTNAALSTLTTPTPATVTISGINAPTPVSVSGQGSPRISINGGSWVTSGNITNGQTLAVRLTSAASGSTTHTATINVGGVTDSWTVSTVAVDTTPDAFSFIDVSAPISMVTSNTIHITGINAPTTVAVSGDVSGQISINGGPWVTSGTIANGQTLTVRMKVVDSNTYIATIDVGGVTDTWTVSPPTPCGSGGTGREVGGYCWYSGANGQSCTDVCASHGGYNNATGTFAGSSGSNSNCNAVLTMLGKGTGNAGDTSVGGIGCYVSFSNSRGRSINPTTAAATSTYASRACACND